MFEWIEGSRGFDIAWGLTAGALCLAVAVPMLWWILPNTRRAVFGPRVDPHDRLQGAYGVFGMALACTNIGCRLIDHGPLEAVHPTFFVVTVLYVALLGPRVGWLLLRPHRRITAA